MVWFKKNPLWKKKSCKVVQMVNCFTILACIAAPFCTNAPEASAIVQINEVNRLRISALAGFGI